MDNVNVEALWRSDREERMEKAARAIAAHKRGLWPLSPEIDKIWTSYLGQARAAIAAFETPISRTVQVMNNWWDGPPSDSGSDRNGEDTEGG